MFTSPMPSWQHSHDINWRQRSWPVMRYDVPLGTPEQGFTLFFWSLVCIEWILGPFSRLYFRGRIIRDAKVRELMPDIRLKLPPGDLSPELSTLDIREVEMIG